MGGLVTEWLWPYKLQPTRFFKTPNGLVLDTRTWPHTNLGNTVSFFNHTLSFCYKFSILKFSVLEVTDEPLKIHDELSEVSFLNFSC